MKHRSYLTQDAALKVYLAMIVPLITYSCTHRIPSTNIQNKKLASLDRRASSVVKSENVTPITNFVNRDICMFVKKCLLKTFNSEIFDQYFSCHEHSKNTRNNSHSIRLPRVKLELARQGFFFAGGTLYNALPLELRKTDNIMSFKKDNKEYFK